MALNKFGSSSWRLPKLAPLIPFLTGLLCIWFRPVVRACGYAAQTAVAESHGSVHVLQVAPMAGREATLSATSVIDTPACELAGLTCRTKDGES